MRFLVLGASGMAGHTISIYLKEQGHNVTTYSRKPFLYSDHNILGDLSDLNRLTKLIEQKKFDAIINSIGILNHAAEMNKPQAVLLNSYFPHYLAEITKETSTKIIQLSTDCVFSGKIGKYNEDSIKDGETFYDRTKAIGELENNKDLTFRNSIIGPDMNEQGIGLFNWFMKQNSEIKGYTKAIWNGVTTLTLAKAIEKAIVGDLPGVYHLVNDEAITKYDLLGLFNKYFKNNELVIKQSSDVIIDKTLINNRTDFDFKVPSYEIMLQEMRNWIQEHKELYPHYFK